MPRAKFNNKPFFSIAVGNKGNDPWLRPHWRILCYHEVLGEFTDNFRRQLQAFLQMGFTFVSLEEGLRLLLADELRRPIMTVTFDDGDCTIYRNVLPVLDELDIKAFLYVTADYIKKGILYRNDTPLPAMNWAQLRQWLQQGHGIGSHTLTHAPLHICSRERIVQEWTMSKNILEENCEVPVRHFSYPWGRHTKQTYKLIKHGGLYDSAATIHRGKMYYGQDPYKLRRDVCDPRVSVESVIRIMRLADKWYWLRHFRRKPRRCWERHPEEKWEALTDYGTPNEGA
jgi:peptidoglycan/xylan/chitin deacetylase (PgdA/CDA1 family)